MTAAWPRERRSRSASRPPTAVTPRPASRSPVPDRQLPEVRLDRHGGSGDGIGQVPGGVLCGSGRQHHVTDHQPHDRLRGERPPLGADPRQVLGRPLLQHRGCRGQNHLRPGGQEWQQRIGAVTGASQDRLDERVTRGISQHVQDRGVRTGAHVVTVSEQVCSHAGDEPLRLPLGKRLGQPGLAVQLVVDGLPADPGLRGHLGHAHVVPAVRDRQIPRRVDDRVTQVLARDVAVPGWSDHQAWSLTLALVYNHDLFVNFLGIWESYVHDAYRRLAWTSPAPRTPGAPPTSTPGRSPSSCRRCRCPASPSGSQPAGPPGPGGSRRLPCSAWSRRWTWSVATTGPTLRRRSPSSCSRSRTIAGSPTCFCPRSTPRWCCAAPSGRTAASAWPGWAGWGSRSASSTGARSTPRTNSATSGKPPSDGSPRSPWRPPAPGTSTWG